MPLDPEEAEKLYEDLNALFDLRIKDRVEESVQRYLPLVDAAIKRHIEQLIRSPTSWLNSDQGGEVTKWIKKEAESAADHYIRLFGGAPALREIVNRLWSTGAEKYIETEVNRRLRDIMKKVGAVVPTA